jgi:hypothetical protein
MNTNDGYVNILKENSFLKHEMLKTLDEKEELLLLCKNLIEEKEAIERKYHNLRNSKLGRITIWFWGRRAKKKHARS